MKKYLSLFALWPRQCVYKFLLLLAALAAAQSAVMAAQARAGRTLEQALEQGRFALVCAPFFLLTCALMASTGCQGSGRLGYTLARLRVSERAVFLCHWAHNCLYFFLLWCAQAGIMLGLCALHARLSGVDYGPQAVLLASYRTDFFHALLPLADWRVYLCNALAVLALGAATAQFSALERRGGRGRVISVVMTMCLIWFPRGMDSEASIPLAVVFALVTAWCAVTGMGFLKEVSDETA